MKVWVTRDEGEDGPLCTALRDAGLTPVLEPVLTRRVVTDVRPHIARLTAADWLVLTSTYAIEAVPLPESTVPRVAVVGATSRDVATSRGLRVELVAAQSDGRSLFAELALLAAGRVVCYPRSSQADVPDLPERVTLDSPVLYETVERRDRCDVPDDVDVIAVASPSAVRAVGRADRPFASIGRTTSAALRALGIEPWVEAREPGFAALARAIADQPGSSPNQRA